MTQTTEPTPTQEHPRVRWDAIAQLVLAAAGAGLAITVSYGFNLEYADTADSNAGIAKRSFVDFWIGLFIVFGFASGAVAAARRSRGRRVMTIIAAALAVVSVIGIPAGAVLGMHEKLDRYPDLPSCTGAFNRGPAVPVVRAAREGFGELDHPSPFSGTGASGVDGCAAELLAGGDAEVTAAYRRTLVENGWRIDRYDRGLVSATKDGQEFEATRRRGGAWWVWIGPEGTRWSTR